ncbi:MAG: formate dehydrogenase accessory protein FdhE [Conexivisphaera sp.]
MPSGELEKFEEAIRKYRALLPEEPDLDRAKRIEEVQLRIADELRDLIDEGAGLDAVLGELDANGTLRALIEEVAEELGPEDRVDAEEAYRKAVGGDVEGVEGMSALLVIQAVARAYAEKYEARNGRSRSDSDACPLCGTESRTMVREGNTYYMVCPLCSHEWYLSDGSLRCPKCGESERLGVYTDRRGILGLASCQGCGHTWHLILGEVDAPRVVLPLIGMGAERFRRALPRGVAESAHDR